MSRRSHRSHRRPAPTRAEPVASRRFGRRSHAFHKGSLGWFVVLPAGSSCPTRGGSCPALHAPIIVDYQRGDGGAVSGWIHNRGLAGWYPMHSCRSTPLSNGGSVSRRWYSVSPDTSAIHSRAANGRCWLQEDSCTGHKPASTSRHGRDDRVVAVRRSCVRCCVWPIPGPQAATSPARRGWCGACRTSGIVGAPSSADGSIVGLIAGAGAGAGASSACCLLVGEIAFDRCRPPLPPLTT